MRISILPVVVVVFFSAANYCKAQEPINREQTLPTAERLKGVEKTLKTLRSRKHRNDINLLRKAERELKGILETDPSSVFKSRVEAYLDIVNEGLAYHDLLVASFYMNIGNGQRALAARVRLLNITQHYPKFSKMDEVLFRLSVVSVMDGKEDEAVRYSWKLICNYPNSEYRDAAIKKLDERGVSFSREGCEKYGQKESTTTDKQKENRTHNPGLLEVGSWHYPSTETRLRSNTTHH